MNEKVKADFIFSNIVYKCVAIPFMDENIKGMENMKYSMVEIDPAFMKHLDQHEAIDAFLYVNNICDREATDVSVTYDTMGKHTVLTASKKV